MFLEYLDNLRMSVNMDFTFQGIIYDLQRIRLKAAYTDEERGIKL